MNILPLAFSIGTFTMDVPHDGMFHSFNPLASVIGHALNSNTMDHSPGPITTTEFPDIQPKANRKRTRHTAATAGCSVSACETCSICLDAINEP